MHRTDRRVSKSTVARVSCIVLLCMIATGCESTGSIESTFGNELKYQYASEPIDARVDADGTYFTTRLEINGHRGQRMEVRIHGDNNSLLGFRHVVPDYDATVWEKFSIFVPKDRLRGMRADSGIDLYVVDPSNPNQYVGHVRYDRSNLSSPDILWDWVEYRDGTTLASGERGMSITVSLQINGRQGQSVRTYAVVTDLQLKDIAGGYGGPIYVEGPTVTPAYDSTVYQSLTFEVPYSRLKQIPPNMRVKISPSAESGGKIVLGNMHFTTWAGGTTEEVQQKVAKVADEYRREAEQLDRQIEALRKGGGE